MYLKTIKMKYTNEVSSISSIIEYFSLAMIFIKLKISIINVSITIVELTFTMFLVRLIHFVPKDFSDILDFIISVVENPRDHRIIYKIPFYNQLVLIEYLTIILVSSIQKTSFVHTSISKSHYCLVHLITFYTSVHLYLSILKRHDSLHRFPII